MLSKTIVTIALMVIAGVVGMILGRIREMRRAPARRALDTADLSTLDHDPGFEHVRSMLESLAGERDQLTLAHERASTNLVEALGSLDHLQAEIGRTNQAVFAAEAEAQGLRDALAQTQTISERLRDESAAHQAESERLSASLLGAEGTAGGLASDLAEVRAEVTRLSAALDAANAEAPKRDADIQDAKHHVERLSGELRAASERQRELEGGLAVAGEAASSQALRAPHRSAARAHRAMARAST